MRHALRFASLELPGHWQDRTSYSFVRMQDASLPIAAARGLRVRDEPVGVTLSLVGSDGEALESVVERQLGLIASTLPHAKIIGRQMLLHPRYDECPCLEIELRATPQQTIWQQQVFLRSPRGTTVCMTFSRASRGSSTAADIREIFDSFTFGAEG